jgi:hypothetical protein
LAIAPLTLISDGKNYTFLGYSILTIIFVTIVNFRSFSVSINIPVIILGGYMVLVSLINFKTSEALSIAYSLFFISSYLFFSGFMTNRFSNEDYRFIIKFLLIVYLIGTLIGQAYVYMGLFKPLYQLSRGNFHGGFHTILEGGVYRFYSFASEPSYAAFIVVLLYYSYILVDPQKGTLFKGKNLFFFFILIYMIVMFRSSYGIILLMLILASYFGLSRSALLIYALGFVSVVIVFLFFEDFGPLTRVMQIAKGWDINNFDSLKSVDFNAYVRIAPMLQYVKTHSLDNIYFYIGHGASASKKFVIPQIYAAYRGEFVGGFIPAFIYDYGIIGFALVLLFVRSILPRLISVSAIIIVLMLFNANLNTQLFWFSMMCLMLNKHFLTNISDSKQRVPSD